MPASADDALRALRDIERLADAPPSGPAGAAAPEPFPEGLPGYLRATRTATYGFLAALPLLILYEIGIVLANTGYGEVRVGADVWIKQVLAGIGVTGWLLLGVVVALIGAAVWWGERDRRPPMRASYFGGIVLESAVYAVVLAFVIGNLVGALFGAALAAAPGALWPAAIAAQFDQLGLPLKLALSIGAGLYEELVFRVLLVGGLFVGFRKLMDDRRAAYVAAAVLGALVFSAVHHLGSLGDPFTLRVFTFRFLFGLALNGVFLLRGFAVAAWAHALYDVFVVTTG